MRREEHKEKTDTFTAFIVCWKHPECVQQLQPPGSLCMSSNGSQLNKRPNHGNDYVPVSSQHEGNERRGLRVFNSDFFSLLGLISRERESREIKHYWALSLCLSLSLFLSQGLLCDMSFQSLSRLSLLPYIATVLSLVCTDQQTMFLLVQWWDTQTSVTETHHK